MGPQVVAIGGPGDDAFVVETPAETTPASTSLGVVLDFFSSTGDRLEFGPETRVRVVSVSPDEDVLAMIRPLRGMQEAPSIPGARLALDFDGDGREDAFILLGAGTNARTQPISGGYLDGHRGGPPPLGFAVDAPFQPMIGANFAAPEGLAAVRAGAVQTLTAFQIAPGFFIGRADTLPPAVRDGGDGLWRDLAVHMEPNVADLVPLAPDQLV
jgi:hypothetical protein